MIATCPCGAQWTGRAEHCCACHATFSGTTAGDLHRTGDHAVSTGPNRRRCRTADEMLAKGLEPRDNRYGHPIWGKRDSEKPSFWLSQDAPGLRTGDEWAPVPPVLFSALPETASAKG